MVEMNEDNGMKDTIDAAAGLMKAVPVYDDLLQPAAQELGKNLHTVSKVVTVALAPVRGLVWGFERIETYLGESLSRKLANTPRENIEPPPVKVAGPVFEAMRFCTEDEELKEMFSNLLANSMDKETKNRSHPAFVEVLKNLTSDEAKILNYIASFKSPNLLNVFPVIDQTASYPSRNANTVINPLTSVIATNSGCENPELVATYINNLTRLGVFGVKETPLVKSNVYDEIENSENYKKNQKYIESMDQYLEEPVEHKAIRRHVYMTSFGKDLLDIAVRNKETPQQSPSK